MVWMEDALRRSGGGSGDGLDGRDKECCSCFSQFGRDLLEVASSGGRNADPVLGFCNGFARNGSLSNGIQETPHKGVSCF